MMPSAIHIGLIALSVALAVVAAAASVAVAQTDPKASADEHFKKGVAAFRDRRFGDAAPEFEEAYRLSPAYVVLYNIGQVNAALGRSVEAVEAYERYLKQGAGEVPAERAREVEAEIAKQLDRIGTVAVRTSPDGAEIRIDGRLVGTTPLGRPVRATVGRHTFEATRRGFSTTIHEVEVMGKAERALDLKLDRSSLDEEAESRKPVGDGPRPLASAPPPQAITVVEIPRPAPVMPSSDTRRTAPGINWQRVIGYAAVVGGLATTTVGGLWAYDGWNKMNEANDRLRNVTLEEWQARKPQYDIDYASAMHRNHVGWTVAGIGAATLVGGVIVVATAPDRNASLAISPSASMTAAHAGGLVLSGAW